MNGGGFFCFCFFFAQHDHTLPQVQCLWFTTPPTAGDTPPAGAIPTWAVSATTSVIKCPTPAKMAFGTTQFASVKNGDTIYFDVKASCSAAADRGSEHCFASRKSVHYQQQVKLELKYYEQLVATSVSYTTPSVAHAESRGAVRMLVIGKDRTSLPVELTQLSKPGQQTQAVTVRDVGEVTGVELQALSSDEWLFSSLTMTIAGKKLFFQADRWVAKRPFQADSYYGQFEHSDKWLLHKLREGKILVRTGLLPHAGTSAPVHAILHGAAGQSQAIQLPLPLKEGEVVHVPFQIVDIGPEIQYVELAAEGDDAWYFDMLHVDWLGVIREFPARRWLVKNLSADTDTRGKPYSDAWKLAGVCFWKERDDWSLAEGDAVHALVPKVDSSSSSAACKEDCRAQHWCTAWTAPQEGRCLLFDSSVEQTVSGAARAGARTSVCEDRGEPTSVQVCVAIEEGTTGTAECPQGFVLNGIAFAGYGKVEGKCPQFTMTLCDEDKSAMVGAACLGKQTCDLEVTRLDYGSGRCPRGQQKLGLQAICTSNSRYPLPP